MVDLRNHTQALISRNSQNQGHISINHRFPHKPFANFHVIDNKAIFFENCYLDSEFVIFRQKSIDYNQEFLDELEKKHGVVFANQAREIYNY